MFVCIGRVWAKMPDSNVPSLIYLKIIMSKIHLHKVQNLILINLCDTIWPCFTASVGVSVVGNVFAQPE